MDDIDLRVGDARLSDAGMLGMQHITCKRVGSCTEAAISGVVALRMFALAIDVKSTLVVDLTRITRKSEHASLL